MFQLPQHCNLAQHSATFFCAVSRENQHTKTQVTVGCSQEP
jgi:hypothetical protein